MARREKQVTRTFDTTTFEIIGIKDNQIVRETSEEVIGKMTSEECKRYAEVTRSYMVAGVENVKYNTALYGMPESVFLANAEKLPPRGAKEQEE